MKRLLLPLFFFCFLNSKADWELFPLNQQSYYKFQDYSGHEAINFISMDTTLVKSNYEVNYFNRRSWGDNDSCYSSVINVNQPIGLYGSATQIEMDSLYIIGDTVFYSPSVYFLPHAFSGESWTINSQTITCSNATTSQFLGITDSIKEFTGLPNCTIVLSKHHGFISYVPFFRINSFDNIIHNLVGFNDTTGQYGFQKPLYLNFIPYHAGDILNWETHSEPPFGPWSVSYEQDSITSIVFNPDTITYYYDGKGFTSFGTFYSITNGFQKFVVSDFKNRIETPPNWFCISGGEIFGTENYTIESDSSLSHTLTDDGFYFISNYMACEVYQVTDLAYHYTYNTKQGYTEYLYDAFYPYYTLLVGSRINNIVRGSLNFPNEVNEINSKELIQIYTDPDIDKLFVKSEVSIKEIVIVDLSGKICYHEKSNSKQNIIDTSNFPGSIFTVIVTNQFNQKVSKKFITNN